jgi:hypothetical protein
MILRPLAKIEVIGEVLKAGDKEFQLELRLEYIFEDKEKPERERCFGPDGLETDSHIEMLGRLSGLQNPGSLLHQVRDSPTSEWYSPGVPRGYLLTRTYEYTLRSCNYYFRDEAQEKEEREHPDRRQWTKLPLEYLINLTDLTDKQRDMLFRSINRQLTGGEMGDLEDSSSPAEPTSDDLNNIDQLSPVDLETLISRLEAHQQWDKLKRTARQKAAWFNLRTAHQSQRCLYVKPNGLPCGSPAIKGESFCHWHSQSRMLSKVSNSTFLDASNDNLSLTQNGHKAASAEGSAAGAFEMPVLEDRMGVQLGIMRVCEMLSSRSMDPYTARVMLYGLRLAQRTLEKDAALPGDS